MLSLKVHENRRIPGTTMVRQVKVTPYIRLSSQGNPPVFLQAGKVYGDEGKSPLDRSDMPGWAEEQISRLSPAARYKVGFATKEDIATLKVRGRRNGRNLAASAEPAPEEDEDE